MTDEEHEITYDDHELIEELEQDISTNPTNNSGNNSDELKPKKRVHKTLGELRQPRQKFCPRWQLEFPWLRPNRADESIGYCSICRRELVCKKSHLERHQRSFKHMRLQGFENVFTVNEPEADLIEAHTSGYLDNDPNQDYQVEEMLDELDEEYTTIKVEPTRTSSLNSPVMVKAKYNTKTPPKKRATVKTEPRRSSLSPQTTFERSPQNTISHFKSMEYDRRGDYYYSTPSPPKKDSFDLFFDSISATVKNLPPKLAAEVKSKVSQVIAEFELRAICEQEAQDKAQQSIVTIPTQVASVITVDPSINTNHSEQQTVDGVTHYVYAYQPKIQD
ncbi:protein suppressor of variegation 3-7 [Calliphora vicina]|uniref:protein suppressor of variegation 3-7 n=1 Tax=Calliphora vicina TaxID=7373 RepID=UPI00325BA1F4